MYLCLFKRKGGGGKNGKLEVEIENVVWLSRHAIYS